MKQANPWTILGWMILGGLLACIALAILVVVAFSSAWAGA